jgi:phenylpropionate dioxygenase-like ring-hydroxylating dioxygenase large terminal subunit
MHNGWYQIAFERELTRPLSFARIGELRLVIVRRDPSIRVFAATCPHRGANLADGRLEGETIVCPFHGYCVHLAASGQGDFHVPEYRALSVGGMVFVLLSEAHENGFSEALEEVDLTHFFVTGFTVEARVPPELVIENAFDRRHFQAVHQLEQDLRLALVESHPGTLAVSGQLVAGFSVWQKALSSEPTGGLGFLARIFSPSICFTELSAAKRSFHVLTAATPSDDGTCSIRVSVAGPPGMDGRPPADEIFRALLRDSRMALDQDIKVWEGVAQKCTPAFTADDDLVLHYHRFCEGFLT